MLLVAGLGVRRICQLSGLSRSVIRCTLYGRHERGTPPSKVVLDSTARRVLAVPLPTERHQLAADHMPVLSLGTTRRLQALVAIGYTQSYLARRIGLADNNASSLILGRRLCVMAARARTVEALYQELSTCPPPDGMWTRISRARARRQGWVDPFGWEDEDIDNPEASPTLAPDDEHRPTRRELECELRQLGYSETEIARRFSQPETA